MTRGSLTCFVVNSRQWPKDGFMPRELLRKNKPRATWIGADLKKAKKVFLDADFADDAD